MADISNSVPTELPSTRKLVRSTIIAAAIAVAILVAVVLPAEYGVDPTGVGRVLGLTGMGEIKSSLAKEAALAEQQEARTASATPAMTPATAPTAATNTATPATSTAAAGAASKTDETRIALNPGQGREIKLVMREGARVQYSWSTDRGVVNYDTHADSVNPRRDYHGYAKGVGVASDSGELAAAFDGSHGWFWRNRGKEPLTVTLKTTGEYSALKEVK